MERLAGRVILLWGWQRQLLALLAGAIASLGLAPVDFPAAGFIAFPLLVWLLDGVAGGGGRLARALPFLTTGWSFGFGYFLAGMWWVGAGLLRPDAEQSWVVPAATLGLSAVLALFYSAATLAARPLWSDGMGRIAALAFGFGAAEWLRSILLSGLAWNAIGYTAMPIPILMQASELAGVFGISSIAVFVFSAPALLGTKRHALAGLGLAAIIVVGHIGYGWYRLASPPPAEDAIAVRIVQPSSSGASFDDTFADYLALTGSPATEGALRPQLVLWPELAVPFVLAERMDLLNAIAGTLGDGQILVTGALRGESDKGTQRLHSAAVAVTNEGIIDAADMVRPLPFAGLLDRLLKLLDSEVSLFGTLDAAEGGRRLLRLEGIEALPLIGSEAAIPDLAARQAGDARIILNPAGYAFFSGTPGPHQHLRQAQIQAIEAGLPLMIAMAQGLSAVIDSRGRIVDALSTGAFGFVDTSIPLPKLKVSNVGNTGHRGLTIVAFFAMLALLLSIAWRTI